MFKQEIEKYGQLYDDINTIVPYHTFNVWLRIDVKGFKQNLLNQVSKWSYLFKKYLEDKVVYSLAKLESFIEESQKTLKLEATNEDFHTLLEILQVLTTIKDQEIKTDNMFEPLKAIVDLLKTYDRDFDDVVYNQVILKYIFFNVKTKKT